MFRGPSSSRMRKGKSIIVEMHVNLFNEFHFQKIFQQHSRNSPMHTNNAKTSKRLSTPLTPPMALVWEALVVYFIYIQLFSFSTLRNVFLFTTFFLSFFPFQMKSMRIKLCRGRLFWLSKFWCSGDSVFRFM